VPGAAPVAAARRKNLDEEWAEVIRAAKLRAAGEPAETEEDWDAAIARAKRQGTGRA